MNLGSGDMENQPPILLTQAMQL